LQIEKERIASAKNYSL